ncbi:kelch domain-containing protein 2-like isoform X2 [Penaeus indicus]|uniref:kelch domain-containing protein 2-like isoform X2 n=2 Tax=Penaeus TaxID=133894 RepID=UPI00300D67AB
MSREAPTEKHYVHRRAGHVMISYDKRLFVWGGYMELAHTHPYTLTTHSKCMYHSAIDVWIYEPLLDVWKRKLSRGDIPQQLSGSCAAVHNDHMYLFGGTGCWTNNENDEVENSCNNLWRLHLPTLTWEMLHPEGTSPYSCDKAACWVYKNRFYVFGGFGPPREFEVMPKIKVQFVRDNIFHRGWIDQLVYYDIDTNQWVWPDTTGPKPTPRAAHSADVTGDKVYIFGGRYREVRMNDLHCLDLLTNAWSGNLTNEEDANVPEGRSWHTFNFISGNKAIMYGGFNTTQQVLNDCWMMKVGRDLLGFTDTEWIEVPLAYDHGEPRCWHATAVIPDGEVYIHSGLTQPFYITMALLIDHAEEMVVLRFSPPSLQRLTIEAVCGLDLQLRSHWCQLPQTLQHILKTRTCPDRIL